MKKIFTLIAAFTLGTAAYAQVKVTYQVDVTDYLAGGAVLAPTGIRVGGNFSSTSGVSIAAMSDWAPSDANSAMTLVSGNLWEIAVTYPSASIGSTQLYKFVNGDWTASGGPATNEGIDPANTIGSGGCGTDDGAGNVNRTLVIPAQDVTVTFCWDACVACAGTQSIAENNAVNALVVAPNPVKDIVTFSFDVNGTENVMVNVYDVAGKVVATHVASNVSGAGNVIEMNISELNAGSYIYSIVAGEKVSTGKLSKF